MDTTENRYKVEVKLQMNPSHVGSLMLGEELRIKVDERWTYRVGQKAQMHSSDGDVMDVVITRSEPRIIYIKMSEEYKTSSLKM